MRHTNFRNWMWHIKQPTKNIKTLICDAARLNASTDKSAFTNKRNFVRPLTFKSGLPHMMFQQNPADRHTSLQISSAAPGLSLLPHPALPAATYSKQQHIVMQLAVLGHFPCLHCVIHLFYIMYII